MNKPVVASQSISHPTHQSNLSIILFFFVIFAWFHLQTMWPWASHIIPTPSLGSLIYRIKTLDRLFWKELPTLKGKDFIIYFDWDAKVPVSK